MKPRFPLPALVGFVSVNFFFSQTQVQAQSTWVGDTSQDWNQAANWSSDPNNPTGNFTINTPASGPYPILTANSAFTPVDILLGSGDGASGRFDHRAGLVSLQDPLDNWAMVGRSGGTGVYNLADTANVGAGISGFAQGSGSLAIGKLHVGGAYYAANGTGVMNINTSGTITASSTAAFTIDNAGGQNASIIVGRGATGVGTINLEAGTVNSVGDVWIGSLGAGTVAQTGGVVNVGGLLQLSRNNNDAQAGTGLWNISGTGTLNIENDLILAYAGNSSAAGRMNIEAGGTVNVASTTERWLIVNRYDSTKGELTVDGGTLNLNANTDIRFSYGNGTGTSFVTLKNGGQINGGATSVVDLMQSNVAGNNTFNLDGGTLSIGQIISIQNSGTAAFNFNGGTLKATAAGGNFVDLGGANQRANVKAGGAIIDSNGFNVTIPEPLRADEVSTGGGLTKKGAGTLTLNGANTYTGNTVVEGGTLALGGAGSIVSPQITINGTGAKFTAPGTPDFSQTDVVLTQGELEVNGFLGDVTVADNAANTISASNLAISSLSLAGDARLRLTTNDGSTAATIDSFTANPGSDITVDAINLAGTWANDDYLLVSGDLSDGNFQRGTITPPLSGRQEAQITAGEAGLVLSITGVIPYWAGVNEDQTPNSNWVSGEDDENWFSDSFGATYTFYEDGDSVVFADFAPNGTVNISAGDVSPQSVLVDNASLDYLFTGTNGIAGSGIFTKKGAGALTLQSANTYSGGTILESGRLNLNNASAIGTGTLTIASQGAAVLGNTSGGAITLSTNNPQAWNADFEFAGPNNLNLGTGTVTLSANRVINTSDAASNLTVGGNITGNFELAKTGPGRLTLGSNSNSYGATVVRNGTLAFGETARSGNGNVIVGDGTTATNGHTAIMEVSSGTVTLGNELWISHAPGAKGIFNLSGGVVNIPNWLAVGRDGDDGTLNMSGGELNVTGANVAIASFAGNAGVINMSGGTLTAVGHIRVGEEGTGTLNVSGDAFLQINGDIGVRIGHLAAGSGVVNLGSGGGAGPDGLIFANQVGSASVNSTLNFNGGTLRARQDSATFLTGINRVNVRDGGAVIDTNGFNVTVNQPLLHSNIDGDAATDGGLVKVGPGTLTLTGNHTYTGDTTVEAGTLNATGSIPGNVILDDGASLSNGGGTTNALAIGGSLTLDGGTGAALGTSSPVSLTSPGITVGGNVTVGGAVTVNASKPSWAAGSHRLLSYTGTFTGFGNLQLGTLANLSVRQTGGSFSLTHNTTDKTIEVTVPDGSIYWRGNSSDVWDTATNNWVYEVNPTSFAATGEAVTFDDNGIETVVDIPANVTPLSTTFNNTSKSYTLFGVGGIASGPLIKNGTGMVTLTNVNTSTGPITINQGTLRISTGGSIASTAVTNNANLTYNISADQTFAGTITGTGVLTKQGAGTLTLSNATVGTSGGTVVSGGKLVANATGLSAGSVQVAAGATVSFTGTAPAGFSSSAISGAGAILQDTANTVVFTGNHAGFSGTFTHSAADNNSQFNSAASGSPNAAYNLTAGELLFAAEGDYTVQLGSLASTGGTIRGGNTATGTATLQIGALNTNTTITGALNNGATKVIAVTKVGNGTLTFSGTKNYTGPTLVSGGKLAIGGGLGGSLTVNSGAALALTVAATPEGQPARVIAGDVTFNGGHTIELTAAEAPADGSYTLLTSNGTIGITGTPYIVFNGVTGSVSIQGNNLVLTVGSGGGSNFGTWATQNGVTGGAGGDSDNDGILNLVEYALNLNPNGSDGAPGTFVNDTVTFMKRQEAVDNGDVEYSIEVSSDLGIADDWTALADDAPGYVNDDYEISYTLPAGQGKIFARLRVKEVSAE